MTIYTKLLDIQKESTKLKKDANNPFFKSNYITLDNIIATYNEKLSEKLIVCYHYTKDNKLTTVLIDTEDNSKVESEFNVLNNDPQKAGSEITYGKRYNLGQLLNIQTDLDDDWNLASKAWNTKAHYPKEERWLMQVINDMKSASTVEDRVKFKDEWKTFAKSEKQVKWLTDEWNKLG